MPSSTPIASLPESPAQSWFNGSIDFPDNLDDEPDFDPDRLAECGYWRCQELFERKTTNQRYCRKACRSRQNKWQRAQERRANRS